MVDTSGGQHHGMEMTSALGRVTASEPIVVAIDHPSLFGLVQPFLDALEGGVDGTDTDVVADLLGPAAARFGMMLDGTLVAMATVTADARIAMVALAEHRGRGFGSRLLAHLAEWARQEDVGRLVMPASRRSRRVRMLARRHGWTAVDMGSGRIDLFFDRPARRTG